MKKILLLLIAIASAISLTACGTRGMHANTNTDADKTVENNSPSVENQDTFEALTGSAAPAASYKLGDVNKDGNINNSDILLIYKYLFNKSNKSLSF